MGFSIAAFVPVSVCGISCLAWVLGFGFSIKAWMGVDAHVSHSVCAEVCKCGWCSSGDVLRHSRIAPWGSPAVKDLDTIVVRLRSVWGSRSAPATTGSASESDS